MFLNVSSWETFSAATDAAEAHALEPQTAGLVEGVGKFNTILEPGLNFLIPILDKVPSQKVSCGSTGASLGIFVN